MRSRAEKGEQAVRRAESSIGVVETSDGRWTLPGVDLDTFFIMRRTAPDHRAGFRAWVLEQDGGVARKRLLMEWDNKLAAFQSAPMK